MFSIIWTKPLIQVLCHLGIAFHFALPSQIVTLAICSDRWNLWPSFRDRPVCMTQLRGKWYFEGSLKRKGMDIFLWNDIGSFQPPNPRNVWANQVSELTWRQASGQNLTNLYVRQCRVLLRKIWEGNELDAASMLMCKQWKLWVSYLKAACLGYS